MVDDPHYEHRACGVCGARTDDEAGNRCQLFAVGDTGEYACSGGAEEESYPDGRLRFLSSAGIAAIDAWVTEQIAKNPAAYGFAEPTNEH